MAVLKAKAKPGWLALCALVVVPTLTRLSPNLHSSFDAIIQPFPSSSWLLVLRPIESRSLCDDVQSYFDIPVPLDGDMAIDLDVLSIECEANGELPDELDEIIVQGGTLTITSTHSSAQ